MNDVSRCNVKCENNKYLSCKRYLESAEEYQGYLVNFNLICNSTNNYKYFNQNDIQMQVVNDETQTQETETNTEEKQETNI